MTKKILFILLIPFLSFSQNIDKLFIERGEVYFSFEYKNKNQLNEISDIVSIDSGIQPLNPFAYKSISIKFVKFPISEGICPINELLCNIKNSRFAISPILLGISPLKLLLPKNR